MSITNNTPSNNDQAHDPSDDALGWTEARTVSSNEWSTCSRTRLLGA